MKNTIVWIVVVLVILALCGWYWYSQNSNTSSGIPGTAAGINGSPNQGNLGQVDNGQPQQPGDGTDVSQNLILGLSGDGSYLTAYNGMAVYRYGKDTKGVSNCSGQCATNWPPYTVSSAADVHIPQTFTASDVGTITRADGTLQVTYKGNPLYFYIKDTKPGDTLGNKVNNVWFLVQK